MFKKLGPGILVTAAFVGPGTITTASKAGAGFGFALLWAVGFSIIATIVLQEMAARLGIVSRQGLGEAVRSTFPPSVRVFPVLLVVLSIGFGNAAYQTGNLTGAALGLEAIFGWSLGLWALVVAGLAFALLATGTYKVVERVLIGLVLLMSGMFLVTACTVRPDWSLLWQGFLRPTIPDKSLTTIIALIGTTVVPYNLFLHASSVCEKWSEDQPTDEALREARWDSALSILLGGFITAAIVATAATAFHPDGEIKNAAHMAKQLSPLLGGSLARHCFAIGLLAAGLTSAITAPLAAAYAVTGAMGWKQELDAWPFRMIWATVLLVGAGVAATLQSSPTETILIAQVANGLLLPFIAIFLLIAVNRSTVMQSYRNGWLGNVLAIAVVLIAMGLGGYKILQQMGWSL